MKDATMANRIPRYEPSLSLPREAYVPGQSARPSEAFAGETPQQSIRFGIDLFNGGFYWEAHEAWESAWMALGRNGAAADTLQGLIHLAACGVKARQASVHGVSTHAEKAIQRWCDAEEDLGIASLSKLTEQVKKVRQTPSRILAKKQENVVIVFDFQIELSGG